MDLPELPKYPEATDDVKRWLNERCDYGAIEWDKIKAWSSDAPAEVREYCSACLATREEIARVRAGLPIDDDPSAYRWRMFGGDWIAGQECAESGGAGWNLRAAAWRIAESQPESTVREFAAHLYEWKRVREAASDSLMSRIAGLTGAPR